MSKIKLRIDADLRANHGLTYDDIYQSVVETISTWVAESQHWTRQPQHLPAEGTHTLVESCTLLSNPDRYKCFPSAIDEYRWRWQQITARLAST